MKYKYIFVDGTESEVDVDEETYRVLRQLDRKMRYNKAKNYTVALKYRTIEDYDGTGYEDLYNFSEEDYGGQPRDGVWEAILKKEQEQSEALFEYFRKYRIADKKEQLLKVLTEKQALAYFYTKFVKMKTVDIAKLMGVTEGAIRKLFIKAEANLQKLGIEKIKKSDELKLMEAIFLPQRK